MDPIQVIEEISNCEGIGENDKVEAIAYIVNGKWEQLVCYDDTRKKASTPYEAVLNMYRWDDSPQGYRFWEKIFIELENDLR